MVKVDKVTKQVFRASYVVADMQTNSESVSKRETIHCEWESDIWQCTGFFWIRLPLRCGVIQFVLLW